MWRRGRGRAVPTAHPTQPSPNPLSPNPTIVQSISHPPLITNRFPSALMSHSHTTTASSTTAASSSESNFQLIINNALEAYKKRTKQDLLTHPLSPQLQACESPGSILAVLQQQIHGLDQPRNSDDQWTRWLDPTINVLFAFSSSLAGVGMVCLRICAYLRSAHSYLFDSPAAL
jgi:hypothetical protein